MMNNMDIAYVIIMIAIHVALFLIILYNGIISSRNKSIYNNIKYFGVDYYNSNIDYYKGYKAYVRIVSVTPAIVYAYNNSERGTSLINLDDHMRPHEYVFIINDCEVADLIEFNGSVSIIFNIRYREYKKYFFKILNHIDKDKKKNKKIAENYKDKGFLKRDE